MARAGLAGDRASCQGLNAEITVSYHWESMNRSARRSAIWSGRDVWRQRTPSATPTLQGAAEVTLKVDLQLSSDAF